jgi:hypothetical protein
LITLSGTEEGVTLRGYKRKMLGLSEYWDGMFAGIAQHPRKSP